MKPITRALDRWFGRGEAAITTPPMDGAFRPNDLLDDAAAVLEAPAARRPGRHDAGSARFRLAELSSASDKLEDEPVASFDAEISALTGLPDGGAAAGLVDGRIVFVGGAK